jgi:hypothetical protein
MPVKVDTYVVVKAMAVSIGAPEPTVVAVVVIVETNSSLYSFFCFSVIEGITLYTYSSAITECI